MSSRIWQLFSPLYLPFISPLYISPLYLPFICQVDMGEEKRGEYWYFIYLYLIFCVWLFCCLLKLSRITSWCECKKCLKNCVCPLNSLAQTRHFKDKKRHLLKMFKTTSKSSFIYINLSMNLIFIIIFV